MVAVYSVLARLTGHIAVGAMKPWVTQALSSDNMTDAIKAVAAVVLAVLTICAIGTAHLTPVPNPARVTVRALALYGVTMVPVFAGRTHLLTVFAKEAFGAELITSCSVPASVTGDAASLCHLAWLLSFTMSTSVPAVLTVEPCRTRLPAELPTISWCAGTRAVCLVALSVDALAVALATLTPEPLPALAAPCELVTRRVVTVTLDSTVPPRPAWVAYASPCHRIADGVNAAVAVVVALWTPDARVACAFASLLVTLALLAHAGILTVWSPAVVVAGTLAGQVVTLAVWVTVTLPFAVRAPELCRALSVTASSKVSMAASAFIGSDTHLILVAGEVPFTERCQAFIP